jgi:hypothetical protein
LRLEARVEAIKSDILSRVFALILGAMLGLAKLLGH